MIIQNMVFRSKYCLSAIALGLLMISSAQAQSFPDLKISSSDIRGISIIYTPETETLAASNQTAFSRLKIPHHGADGVPGEYPKFFRRHLIALPPGAKAVLTVKSIQTRTLNNITLQKIPSDPELADLPVDRRQISAEFVSISAPFQFRRHRVVEVILRPLRYDPANKTLTLVQRLEFSLNFIGGKPAGVNYHPRDAFARVILNYPQAVNWIVPPSSISNWDWPQNLLLKIQIADEGMYILVPSDLEELGLDLNDFPLSLFSLYNNGGQELPLGLNAQVPDSLIENALYIQDQDSDDVFNGDDFILFYARGTDGWAEGAPGGFSHYINHFTYYNTYWLELKSSGSPGKRMATFGSQASPSIFPLYTKSRVYREDEKVIYAHESFPGSGMNWYGDYFDAGATRTYSHNLSNVASGYYKISLQFKELESNSYVKVYWNNVQVDLYSISSFPRVISADNLTTEGINTLKLESYSNSSFYLDWYEIEYHRYLQATGGKLLFENEPGSGTAYDSVSGLSDSAFIFKITNFAEVKYLRGKSFKENLSSAFSERYCAYESGAFASPENITIYSPPQSDIMDLRQPSNQAEYLFITHSDFYNQVQQMADFWADEKGIVVKSVNISQIFDQFSWGLYDPVGLRNFLRYAIDNWAFPPQYVVFIGDGDYDYRNIVSEVDKNWIPPYESSVACYDDFYAYVHQNGLPEIILGRYPVISTAQVQILVNKVLKYQDDPLFTPWRTRFTLVGDDEYGEGGEFDSSGKNHVPQSENLYASILPQFLNFNKIYLTEYPVVPGSGGREKPAATDDLIDAINRGTVVVNYYGHGNETVWAHEHVFLLDRDLSRINNGDKYTIYVAGTCDWGYFDIPDRQSFPEQLLTLPANGAIATVSATRLTFSDPNQNLIESIFEYLFADQYNPTTLGEALMMGKIFAGDLANSQSYHLLGDPMLTPCFPRNPAQVTSMQPDSLFAVNLSQASGQIYSGDQIWNDFNGTVYLEVFDAAQFVVYNFAMDTTTTTYILPGKSIFRGPVSASGGNFTSNFVLPLDLTYGGTLGRVSVYFTNNQTDGCGFRDNIYTGSGGVELTDSDSPQAQVFFGDRSYRPGDPVSTSPLFLADIADTFGINLGSSSGHQIALMVDDNLEFNLTEYFEYQLNSYSSGVLQKQLDYLPPGLHDLKFRAWDNFNHPVQLEFTLETADIQPGQDYLYGLLNYPNPFKQQTTIVFHLLEPAEVKIEIYTVGGKLIRALPLQYCQGYVYDRFEWDGRDEKGDKVANGVYLFKVKADFGDGTASKIGRMILMK